MSILVIVTSIKLKKVVMMVDDNIKLTKTLTFCLSSEKVQSLESPRKLKKRLSTTRAEQKLTNFIKVLCNFKNDDIFLTILYFYLTYIK